MQCHRHISCPFTFITMQCHRHISVHISRVHLPLLQCSVIVISQFIYLLSIYLYYNAMSSAYLISYISCPFIFITMQCHRHISVHIFRVHLPLLQCSVIGISQFIYPVSIYHYYNAVSSAYLSSYISCPFICIPLS